ncbi:tRNA (adenosine(37)-N6)-threonylcarbamoyltransferase complex dimerization subunit type 1 TsaB [Paraferrimonas sedimenticola]|uniref:tRNA threonylcarbamoyladenosine biosynthesis protein TsaB n=1 Tax=Paraferrimonas sedimenticola TaxID=375674 RepID=A0AA37RWC9_9GAMM|nr:tRNA (adenosine(37)-N6)-threonylcarbamoyltransferase complex dimerization subunit type 1 TsaB [Paraferrimonas sedimenticola]GLP96510.1 tRNA (adenosine(37)-N6)-threonylcarbamoyltransferase complex dimerization subunit type 1 TsaB [Paraferrimonas sedimenticola]
MTQTYLAIDTCTELCSVALWQNGKIDHLAEQAPRSHSQRLLPMVQDLLQRNQLTLADIDGLVYGRGPGSFTGIRICTSMAQGLSLGADLATQGVSTLAAMALEAMRAANTQQALCAIDARMGEVYWGHYQLVDGRAVLVGEEQVISPAQLAEQQVSFEGSAVAVGTGFDAYPELLSLSQGLSLSDTVKYPNAAAMVEIAAQQDQWSDVESIEPVYLRNQVTWKKLPGRE